MSGTLYMVATPIGNLGDVSARALATLKQVRAVVCEDTRVTRKLLQHFALTTPTLSLHHHSPPAAIAQLVKRLLAGDSLAYVSDAGTPGVADPGGKLVIAAAEAGIPVVAIPGPSAVTAALSLAGLPGNTYIFLGFPPHKKGRQTFFCELGTAQHPVIFFESTHRIMKCLKELAMVIPTRPLVVCRELTKLHETVYRGTAAEIMARLIETSSKGEFVVVVQGA